MLEGDFLQKPAIRVLNLWHIQYAHEMYTRNKDVLYVNTVSRPIDNLHLPCFRLSCKHVFFDCVTPCCITEAGMTNQVWQSESFRSRADSEGVMKPSLFTQRSLWRRQWRTHARTHTTFAINLLLYTWSPIHIERKYGWSFWLHRNESEVSVTKRPECSFCLCQQDLKLQEIWTPNILYKIHSTVKNYYFFMVELQICIKLVKIFFHNIYNIICILKSAIFCFYFS